MNEETKVLEVRKTYTETVEKIEQKIILERNEKGVWVYHSPNAQSHTVEQLEMILVELKKLQS